MQQAYRPPIFLSTHSHIISYGRHIWGIYIVSHILTYHTRQTLTLTTDLQISIFWIKSQLLSPVNSLESDVCFQNWHKSDHAHSLVFPSAFSPQCGKINKNVNLQYCLEYTQIMQLSWYLYRIRTVRSTEQLI